ncbi:hypothetical protein AALP_AA5G124400 [Arabis alpina]|uniref:Uncharacterized protein n=1 Tax=Arabis alpina TaxID=50452 RepID=A0A087GWM6_ARAAL|nr:hypothetical protein AALP_AA5G124400 [Arabis alpina]
MPLQHFDAGKSPPSTFCLLLRFSEQTPLRTKIRTKPSPEKTCLPSHRPSRFSLQHLTTRRR